MYLPSREAAENRAPRGRLPQNGLTAGSGASELIEALSPVLAPRCIRVKRPGVSPKVPRANRHERVPDRTRPARNGMTGAERKAERKANPPPAMITLTVMLGLMAIIDTSIVNVALNDMAGNLGSSVDEIGWVATGYILANVIVMPLNGWLTARFGRRNFYAACVAIFTIASILCGTATRPRALQR